MKNKIILPILLCASLFMATTRTWAQSECTDAWQAALSQATQHWQNAKAAAINQFMSDTASAQASRIACANACGNMGDSMFFDCATACDSIFTDAMDTARNNIHNALDQAMATFHNSVDSARAILEACLDTLNGNKQSSADGFIETLFPNPAHDVITVNFAPTGINILRLNIMDLSGRNILTQNYNIFDGSQSLIVDLKAIPAGNYYLQITDGITISTTKFVVD